MTVMLANQIMNRAKMTHWLLSRSRRLMSSVESSGMMGVLLRTVVRRLIWNKRADGIKMIDVTVDTVARQRKAVSRREHSGLTA